MTNINVDTTETLNYERGLTNYIEKRSRTKGKKRKRPTIPSKTEMLKVRLTENELIKLQEYAITKKCSASQIIREYIHRLPSSKLENTETFPN